MVNRDHMRETRLEGIELSGLRGLNSALWETQGVPGRHRNILWGFGANIDC